MRSIVLLCCAAALLAAGTSVFVAGSFDAALVSAVALLVCAQLVALLAAQRPKEFDDARFASLADRINRNSSEIERLSTRSRDQAQAISAIDHALKNGPRPVPARRAVLEDAVPAGMPEQSAATANVQPHPSAPQQPMPALFLEPVVRIAEGRTAYYKASLQYPPEGPGQQARLVASADLVLPAGASGQWDPHHDVTLMNEVIPIVQTLQARRAATGVLVPVSVATLDDPARLKALVDLLYRHPEAAAGLVLDMHVSALAALPESAMQGLAWLASLGASFCLTGRWASGNDLDALAGLGFTFIDAPSDQLLSPEASILPAARQLLDRSAALGFSVIASGVPGNGQAAALLRAVSLARGPAFAPPRAVRSGVSNPRIQQQVA